MVLAGWRGCRALREGMEGQEGEIGTCVEAVIQKEVRELGPPPPTHSDPPDNFVAGLRIWHAHAGARLGGLADRPRLAGWRMVRIAVTAGR